MTMSDDTHLIVRSMEEEDILQVMSIEKESYDFCWTEKIFRDCMKSGYCCLVLVDKDDNVFGYAVLMIGVGESHVLNICVTNSHRGRGWARHIMLEMIDFSQRVKCSDMFLEVRPSNPIAYGLYQSLGFNDVGMRPGYYKANGGREDAIVMAKSLELFDEILQKND